MFVPLVAREMDVREVIVPQAPAGFSAWGMLMTDLIQEYSETAVGLLCISAWINVRGVAQRLTVKRWVPSSGAGLRRPTAASNIGDFAALLRPRAHTRYGAGGRATISKGCADASMRCTNNGTATR